MTEEEKRCNVYRDHVGSLSRESLSTNKGKAQALMQGFFFMSIINSQNNIHAIFSKLINYFEKFLL